MVDNGRPMTRSIVIIAHDLRSAHNVGSLFRTAEALGARKLYLTGYTPYPPRRHDTRLPHMATKTGAMIAKTALGTESLLPWQQVPSISQLINRLRRRGYRIVALEQSETSVDIQTYRPQEKIALIVGNEPKGIDLETLLLCDDIVEIPLQGAKESLNVVQAAAIALYQLAYF